MKPYRGIVKGNTVILEETAEGGKTQRHCAAQSLGGGRPGDCSAPEGDAALQEKRRAAPWEMTNEQTRKVEI
jgi:hypothetical protein